MNSTAAVEDLEYANGFSLINRWLLYASLMLAPAQFVSGLGNSCPSNLAFLAYNWYTQLDWYWAARDRELHALSLLPAHFNLIYAMTYLGGVSSGSLFFAILLGLGTAGVMILNTVTAWVAWATLQTEGFGKWQFFFFGWRTLDEGWHKFFLLWQIFDSLSALGTVISAMYIAVASASTDKELEWFWRYPMIPVGAVSVLITSWPLIMWTELIYARNNIQSETDWVPVYLFIAQVVAMLIPSCGFTFEGCGEYCRGCWSVVARGLANICTPGHARSRPGTGQQGSAGGLPSVEENGLVKTQPESTSMELTHVNGPNAEVGQRDEDISQAPDPVGLGPSGPKKKSLDAKSDGNV